MDKKYKGVLAIDYDGTIADTNYPTILGRIKGAKKYINKLYNDGWYIIVWTCRCDDNTTTFPMSMAKDWLYANEIPYHKMNEHHPALVLTYNNDSRKIAADFYIDDKSISGLPTWKKMYKYLSKFDSSKSCLRYTEEVEEELVDE